MAIYLEIVSIHAREILDSRGNPTVEADVTVLNHQDGQQYTGTAAEPVPAGLRRWSSETGNPGILAWECSTR